METIKTDPLEPTTTLYRVVFDGGRIGRNHGVEPAMFEVPDLDALAEAVGQHARPSLLSRDIGVDIDPGTGRGHVFAGIQVAAQFTVQVRPEPA